jgi:hypothetical protein
MEKSRIRLAMNRLMKACHGFLYRHKPLVISRAFNSCAAFAISGLLFSFCLVRSR